MVVNINQGTKQKTTISSFHRSFDFLSLSHVNSCNTIVFLYQVQNNQNNRKFWPRVYKYAGALFGPEKCLKEFILTWWTCFENSISVHSIFRPNPISVHFLIVRISDFDLDSYFEYGPKSEIRTIEKWTKIEFEHVIINFEHFSGPKKGTLRIYFVDIKSQEK